MQWRRSGIIFLMLLSFGYAACSYVPAVEIVDSGVSTLFPNAGDSEIVWFAVKTDRVYAGRMELFLEKEGVKFPVRDDVVYLGKNAENRLSYNFTLSSMLEDGIYLLHMKMGGFDYTIPLSISNTKGIRFRAYDNESAVVLEAKNMSGAASVAYETIGFNGKRASKSYIKNAVNGTLTAVYEDKCSNCKTAIEITYNGTTARAERVTGLYSEPYLQLTEFSKDGAVFESCAQGSYNAYVDDEKEGGDEKGIGRVVVDLKNGYERKSIRLENEFAVLLESEVDFSKLKASDISIGIAVVSSSPFTIKITATDEYGRAAKSEGLLEIADEGGKAYAKKIDFEGEYEEAISLKEGEYIIAYGGASAKGKAVGKILEEKLPRKVEEEVVPEDIAPLIAVLLLVALAVMVIVWLKRKV